MSIKYIISIIGALTITSMLAAKTYTVINVGKTFSPDSLSVNVGDTVVFSLASIHNAVEVNKDVWIAGGNTSDGGFSTTYGGGTVIFNSTGLFYFVCQPHASMGMKGRIFVNGATAINKISEYKSSLNIYPNPADNFITVELNATSTGDAKLYLYDITGKLLRNVDLAGVNRGHSYQNVDLSNMVAGRYFIRYSDGTRNLTESFLIIKR